MRAVLILAVLMVWLACILGAIGLTAYLAFTAAGLLRPRPRGYDRPSSPPPMATVVCLVVFAGIMGFFAALASGVLLGRHPGDWSSALAWAALPLWAALAASATAVVLSRRRRTRARELRTLRGYPSSP